MRDIIWTTIIIWVVWKIYDAFKNVSKNKAQKTASNGSNSYQNSFSKEGEVKIDVQNSQKNRFNPDNSEYVDYEEIK